MALYVPALILAGTATLIGDPVKLVQFTSKNPAAFAAASKSIVYSLGLFVALLYVNPTEIAPVQIDGFGPRVIAGGATAFSVTEIAVEALTQLVVLLIRVTFAWYVPATTPFGIEIGSGLLNAWLFKSIKPAALAAAL